MQSIDDLPQNVLVALDTLWRVIRQQHRTLKLASYSLNDYYVYIISKDVEKESHKLSRVWQVDLSNNQLTVIPYGVTDLTGMERLVLSNNQITEIRSEITKLGKLKVLRMDHNKLTQLDELKLGNLRVLDVQNNLISRITDGFCGRMQSLVKLNLSFNKLKIIPAEISTLTNLQELYLDHNELMFLPGEMSELNLRVLTLHDNNFFPTDPNEKENQKKLFHTKFTKLSSMTLQELTARFVRNANINLERFGVPKVLQQYIKRNEKTCVFCKKWYFTPRVMCVCIGKMSPNKTEIVPIVYKFCSVECSLKMQGINLL